MEEDMIFINKILPGNYWLSKSMEFSRVNSCGTLWYLKKWLVYYYYIFLLKQDTLYENDYKEISKIFTDFINSLDENIQEDAKSFFFQVDINSNDFITFQEFTKTEQDLRDPQEGRNRLLTAKKFYFTYVMNLGGQSGYKKYIKDLIQSERSFEKLLTALENKLIIDNNLEKMDGLINDFHASLRNERQIFFYYGIFLGKECADLSGFYNLTSIGITMIYANFYELLLIWEHQKLKMISQSPVADIQNLEKDSRLDYKEFSILSHPYVTLLNILNSKKSISTLQYQYVISKITNNSNIKYVMDVILGDVEKEKLCSQKAESFNRRSEIKLEDFQKELKKFILGIGNLPKDQNSNPLCITSWIEDNKINIENEDKADFIVENYNKIAYYLDLKNEQIYKDFNSELNNKYQNILNNKDSSIEDSVRYNWFMYIINYDISLFINLIYITIACEEEEYNYEIGNGVLENAFSDYKNILKNFGIEKKAFKEYMIETQKRLSEDVVFQISEELGESETYIYEDVRIIEENVSEDNLIEISRALIRQNNLFTSEIVSRKRSQVLINSLKNYYHKNFEDENTKLIKCDCCLETTFIGEAGHAYLEFHHLIPFSTDLGPDHYMNLFGICPNCHRKLHYINTNEKPTLYSKLSINNNMQKNLENRIENLFGQGALEPINLEYLKKEKIIDENKYNNMINHSF